MPINSFKPPSEWGQDGLRRAHRESGDVDDWLWSARDLSRNLGWVLEGTAMRHRRDCPSAPSGILDIAHGSQEAVMENNGEG